MKTSYLDFVLSTVCISVLVALALLITALVSPAHAYYVIVDVAVFLLAYGLLSGLLLRLIRIFSPYPRGHYGMDSKAFTYWKLNAVLADLAWKALAPFNLVFSTPLLYRLMGVDIGRQVALGGTVRDHPLIRIEDYATLGQDSVVVGHAITHDEIVLEPIHIGRNALVGINSVIMPGVSVGEGGVVAPGAVVLRGTRVGSYELWGGVPAKKIKDLPRP
ncbi:DapH/DapD/GlmU-related protein [Motiliproteus sp. SC1-56]|uniref:DapH/DapD/GlmU-related protein n=1 Tax=Motiliproteus sp. SC1-56 TaxID=2799565 RepID=UPI001A8EA1A0|nr:DapH/DapD/GlmU-related protein [Motiliproteus sp. SC1-56]